MGRTLALDTSGSLCSVALIENGALVAERHERIGRGHAEIIIPWISELIKGARADAIIVGCGPGSFTGVRVGVAAARGLSLAWGVPVSGCSSLALVARDADISGPVVVAVEGGHGELFVQLHPELGSEPPDPPVSLPPEQAARMFDCEIVAGNAAARLVQARGFGTVIEADPRARWAEALPTEMRTLPPIPVYGRAPDAKPASP